MVPPRNVSSTTTAATLNTGTTTTRTAAISPMRACPNRFVTIGSPISTKLLRKEACTITATVRGSFSIRRKTSEEISAVATIVKTQKKTNPQLIPLDMSDSHTFRNIIGGKNILNVNLLNFFTSSVVSQPIFFTPMPIRIIMKTGRTARRQITKFAYIYQLSIINSQPANAKYYSISRPECIQRPPGCPSGRVYPFGRKLPFDCVYPFDPPFPVRAAALRSTCHRNLDYLF